MTKRMISTGARLAALALTTTCAFGLAACEEHPYPSAAPREGTAAPRPDDSTLAGAPTVPRGYQASPTTRSPALYPPSGSGYPPPAYAQNGYPPAPGYGPPPAGYPPGYGHRDTNGAPPEIVTMQPIPNPPERPRRFEHHYGRGHHHRHGGMSRYTPTIHAMRGVVHHHHHRHTTASRYAVAPQPMAPRPHHHAPVAVVPVHRHAPAPASAAGHAAPRTPAPIAPVGSQLTKPQPLDHQRHHHHATEAGSAAAASGGPTNAVASNTTAATNSEAANTTSGPSEADRYKTLVQILRDVFANSDLLSAPSHMEANQPATVTLTLPAEFAQMARAEAAKENLTAAVMTMNLIGVLSGDGYTIVPAEAQSLPLTLDTPTVFQWKVTPTGAARAALKASVRAEAVGDGHSLALGDKSTGSGSATGRVVGFGLLALIALVLLGWAAQRRRPVAAGATKPRASHTNGVN